LSKDEQKRRFLARIDERHKNWKFTEADLHERKFFDEYHDAFEAVIEATAAPHAPWYIVPADHKKFAHLVVGAAIVHALEKLDLKAPKLPPEEHEKLVAARVALEAE
jgi:polyphosphate kinase 2 (PPK2 family)